MRRLPTFIFGVVVGGLLIYCGLHYHVINTPSGLHLVPKVNSTLAETYVDVRGWGLAEWTQQVTLRHECDETVATRRAAIRLDQPREHAQQRALAAPARPDDRDERASGHIKRDVTQHLHGRAAHEGVRDTADLDRRADDHRFGAASGRNAFV